MYHLDLIESDYFGLRFMDSAQVAVSSNAPLPLTPQLNLNIDKNAGRKLHFFGYVLCRSCVVC